MQISPKNTKTQCVAVNFIAVALTVTIFLSTEAYSLDPPPITPNEEFFVLGSPPIIPADWNLIVDGAVEQPLAITLEDFMQDPAATQMATLECYFTAGPWLLVGNANWTGVPLNTILQQAGLLSEAKAISFYALDGYVMGSFDVNDILSRDDILLAYNMNGQVLPLAQGYPLKLVLPGAAGFQNGRWLNRIEVVTSAPNLELMHYPIHARIFEPDYGQTIPIGTYVVRGMVNAGQGIEITKVEISTDGGSTWLPAELLNYFLPNVWKHWQYVWNIPEVGQYIIYVRTEDSEGNLQNQSGPFGWEGFGNLVTVDYDSDSDTVADAIDNCPDVYNPSQGDSDADQIGNACDDDCPNLDGQNPVAFIDLRYWPRTGSRQAAVL